MAITIHRSINHDGWLHLNIVSKKLLKIRESKRNNCIFVKSYI